MGTHPIFESDFDCLTERGKMGKITTNPKSVESRERKAASAAEKKAQLEQAKEDAKWEDNDRTRARKEDRARTAADKREAELARKKENQELYEQEMAAAVGKTRKKKGNENANKVTKAMILQAQMAAMDKSKSK